MLRLLPLLLVLALPACMTTPPPLDDARMIETPGGSIHVRSWGDPSGPPVLMIHGSTSHLEEFEVSLGPQLADDYRLVAYDRPGMGRSTGRPSDAADLDVQAATAAEVIRTLGLSKPVVVGHSYGGAVALRLALDHPDLVSGLVLLAPASHPWDGGAPFFFTIQAAPVIGEIVSTLAWPLSSTLARNSLADRAFSPQPVPEAYFEEADVALAMRPSQVRASARDFTALLPGLREQAPRYRELTLPVSVIAGRQDRIAPIAENIDPDNPAFSNQSVVLLDGVGHMPQHARPDIVEREIEWALAGGGPKLESGSSASAAAAAGAGAP
jgi:pimeloyl-ACP methyl ester carboxylesterase